jgi:glycerol kinase
VLSWQDRRTTEQVTGLRHLEGVVREKTGLLLSPHYAAPKLAQLLGELEDGRARAEAGEVVAGTLDAFLVRGLVGLDATEPGHAGRTLLCDLATGRWDEELCAVWEIPGAALPEIRDSAGVWGEVEGGGMLCAVLGDQQAALLGHGGGSAGIAAAHFGTGSFVLAATGSRPVRRPGLLTAVLFARGGHRTFQLEGSVNSAGSAVEWSARLAGIDLAGFEPRTLDPDRLPWCFPAFAGAAAPWWRPEATGVVAGLDLGVDGERLVAGVLCGVAMRVLDCVDELAEEGLATTLRLSGRLTRLDALVDLLADAGGLPVEVMAEEETGLVGVARLASGRIGEPGGSPRLRRRRRPEWPVDRRRRVRERWRRFARRATELGPPP